MRFQINNFDALKQMCDENKDIQAFNINSNLKSVKTGKNGWGEVVIAIDNATAGRLIKQIATVNIDLAGLFLTYNTKQFMEIIKQNKG